MRDKHLSDVIDYQRDIEPYQLVQIYAGVGSGKNTFVEQILLGEIDGAQKNQKVLLITSRRAKVDETLKYYGKESLEIFCEKIGVNGNVFVRPWYAEEREEYKDNLTVIPDQEGREHHLYQNSVICTGALIAAYLRYCYDPQNVNTYLWEKFDLIVIDEAHSLFTDATYQDAPFHVNELIRHYLRLCSAAVADPESNRMPNCKHIILMTGTPMMLKEYIGEICPENLKVNVLDVREECKNVIPSKVLFIEKKYVKKQIAEKIAEGKRIIYFSNSTQSVKQFCSRTSIPVDKTVASFSKETRREHMKENDSAEYKKMQEVEASIMDSFTIPKQYSLFITTSRYKEGINILDPIDYMFVESHCPADVIQMAGRVRQGVDVLYIVTDAAPHDMDKNDDLERLSAESLCSAEYNVTKGIGSGEYEQYDSFTNALAVRNFEEYAPQLLEADKEGLSQYDIMRKNDVRFDIFIESKFPYMKQSYIDGCFKFYHLKSLGTDYAIREEDQWQQMLADGTVTETVASWFPGSQVSAQNEMYQAAWEYWRDKGIQLNVEYSLEEFTKFIKYWADLFDENPKYPNRVLKRFSNYQFARCGDRNLKRKFITDEEEEKQKKRRKSHINTG